MIDRSGTIIYLAEFVVPKGGDRNQEIPRQHAAQTKVKEDEAENRSRIWRIGQLFDYFDQN